MKLNIFKYGFLTVLCITLISCKKGFLDQVPNDRITMDEVFSREATTIGYLANVYNIIRDDANQSVENPWLGLSDEADVTIVRGGWWTTPMNIGNWDAGTVYYDTWPHYYAGIRSANYFISRADECVEILAKANGRQTLDQYKAEARFLRAYFYFCLLRQYGPFIILPNTVLAPDAPVQDLQFPRSTYDECVAYIKTELDEIIAGNALPRVQPENEFGRATIPMAMAVKARMLLYAASPQFNGNTDYSSFLSADGKPMINQQFSPEKWKMAADASSDIINLGLFDLHRVYDANGNLDPFKSAQFALLTANSKETIFARPGSPNQKDWEVYNSPRPQGGYCVYGPTQQQVDAYRMANGKNIKEDGSGYIEEGFAAAAGKYTVPGIYNMYVGREPRFYVDITYNGMPWFNNAEGVSIVQTYYNGSSGKAGSYDYSRTGYIIRKNYHPDSYHRLNRANPRPWVLFRLGETYLNYAEALNEYDPSNPDILKYLNLIRERGGIPPVETGLTQDQMRNKIREERRVELSFESNRYFDTRRWKIAEQTDGGAFYGMNVDANVPEFYKRTVFENRVFKKNYYLFPVYQATLDRNPLIVQNPGW